MLVSLLLLSSGLLHFLPTGHGAVAVNQSMTPQGLHRLMYEVFRSYLPQTRPVSSGNVTFVFLSISLRSIRALDEQAQVLETSLEIDARWQDEFLTWDESDYNTTSSFLCPQSMVWLPDIIIENSVESQSQMGYDQNVVRVNSTGHIRWMPSEISSTACDIDVTYYPFDIQTCSVTVSTWMSGKDEVDLFPAVGVTGFSLDKFGPSGTWDIISNRVDIVTHAENPTKLKFTLRLKRLRTYYVLNIVLPIVFLSFTASMVFLLPAEAGEKIGMGITVLLAYAVYLTIIADNMPQTSLQVSYLAVYLTLLLGLTAMGVVLAVVVLHIHHKPDDCQIGERTERITRQFRAKLGFHSTRITGHQLEPRVGDCPSPKLSSPTTLNSTPRLAVARASVTSVTENVAFSPPPSYRRSQEEITWSKVAETLDRVLFLLTSCLIAITTLVFLPLIASCQ